MRKEQPSTGAGYPFLRLGALLRIIMSLEEAYHHREQDHGLDELDFPPISCQTRLTHLFTFPHTKQVPPPTTPGQRG
jgi:hypothetical protein